MAPEIFGSSIVAVGSFNPAIFSADWLLAQKLIGADDRDAAQSSPNVLVSSQVAFCETDWFQLQVVDAQLSIHSKGALTPALYDFAQGLLELVPHTPVTAIGLNFMAHFKMGSVADYHKVGDAFAPKPIWQSVFGTSEKKIGLVDLQVQLTHGDRDAPSATADRLVVQLQPSSVISPGIYLMMNDHRAEFSTDSKRANARGASTIVRDHWNETKERATAVFNTLLETALKEPMP